MDSRFRDAEAERVIEMYAPDFGPDLALRIYTSRLLGEDPELVLCRAGSASLKGREVDMLGEAAPVLYVSGDDEDLAAIKPPGFALCDLSFLIHLSDRPGVSDEEVLAEIERRTRRQGAPSPSAYAPIHAILPGKYVDHAQADAILTIVNQTSTPEVVRQVFGDRALYVPYAPPGPALMRRVLEASRGRGTSTNVKPSMLIADRNGIFTWGDTAQESYENLIAAVTRAERYVADTRVVNSRPTISAPDPELYTKIAPITRGLLAEASGRPWILTWRTSAQMRAFCDRTDMTALAQLGCAAPDHAAVTKPKPLIIRHIEPPSSANIRRRVSDAIFDFAATYTDYVRKAGASRKPLPARYALDPWPRVILFEGLGVLTVATDAASAEAAADIYEHTALIIDAAHSMRGYCPPGETDIFDAEHGAASRARAERRAAALERPLDRKIALVTGAAQGVGLAAARALLRAGAHVVLADKNLATLDPIAKALDEEHPARVAHVACDPAIDGQARRATSLACMRFGGLDVLVSNPSSGAEAGALHTPAGSGALHAHLEQTLIAHQNAARAAAEVMLLQGTPGALLFAASRGVLPRGEGVGPSRVTEAAVVALMRQYALDLGVYRIRANAVSLDRVRLEPPPEELSEVRSRPKAAAPDEPTRVNLLGLEVTAEDAADALVYLATAQATTGCVLSVDGGGSAGLAR